MMTLLIALSVFAPTAGGTAEAQQQKLAVVGEQYLADLHIRACLELDAANVRSQVSRDRLVCELADPRLTEIIPLVEHTSYVAITTRFTKERTRLLAIIGERREAAFLKWKKGDGGFGLFQFTSIYYALIKRYPTANFPKKFSVCMQDHVCSAKAQIIYHDGFAAYLARRMPFRWRDQMRIGTLAHGRYLAAAYNGGMIAPYLVLHSRGSQDWPRKLPLARTRNYVKMFELLMEAYRPHAETST